MSERGAIERVGIVGLRRHRRELGRPVPGARPRRRRDRPGSDGAEARLRANVRGCLARALERLGLADGADPRPPPLRARPRSCVAEVDFVQENGPEREDVKRETFRRLDAATAPGRRPRLLARPASSRACSRSACRHPERVLVGHPFNPPHLIPLVEVVGGERTSRGGDRGRDGVLRRASASSRSASARELDGHVANRLQAALWREAFHLVEIGAVTVAEVDAAIAHGPGLRWALMGPCLLNHLSGGAGGLRHTLDHLGPADRRRCGPTSARPVSTRR